MCSSHGDSEASSSASTASQPPKAAILERLTDAHAHPSDDQDLQRAKAALSDSKLKHVCAMSSSLENQQIASTLGQSNEEKVIPCFGVHPWFIHSLNLQGKVPSTKEEHYGALFPSSEDPARPHPSLEALLPTLPLPSRLFDFLATLEENLKAHPTALVGEIGLDKAFRLPNPPSLASASKNSDLQTPLSHQLAVAEAQIEVAIRLQRHVSFHSVRAPQDTVRLLEKMSRSAGWERIHICLHSFGGSPETAIQIQRKHRNCFFSFATIISGRSPRFHDLLRAIEPDRLLVESDFSDTSRIDDQIWEVFEAICEARGWSKQEGVERLEVNWSRFLVVEPAGAEVRRKSKRERKLEKGRQAAEESDDD